MLAARLLKIVIVAALALFAFLVTYDNVVDYGSNYDFVRHVLSMDTTFPGNALTSRAITAPAWWHLVYGIIIAGEALTCLAFARATADLSRALFRDAEQFNDSKRFVFIGAGLGFLVWFLGFMVVGGEWFAMWQSKAWNGQQAAFRFIFDLDRRACFREPAGRRSAPLDWRRAPPDHAPSPSFPHSPAPSPVASATAPASGAGQRASSCARGARAGPLAPRPRDPVSMAPR